MSRGDLPAEPAGDYSHAAVQAWTPLHGEMEVEEVLRSQVKVVIPEKYYITSKSPVFRFLLE